MKKIFNEGNKIHSFISSSGSGTVINYGSGSEFLTCYGSGSISTTLAMIRFAIFISCTVISLGNTITLKNTLVHIISTLSLTCM